MTKAQVWVVVIVIALILIGAEVFIHTHGQNQQSNGVAAQASAVNDCVGLCQTVYDESGGDDTASNQEQACEDACYKAAGLSTTTNSSPGN